MRDIDRLCESYFDLLWHFDPAAASAAGSVSWDGQLGRFDAEAMRTHLAALRATAAALEEMDIEGLADEIDRTALLDDARATIARLDEDRPPARDPGFWLGHLRDALASLLLRPEDPASAGQRARAAGERIAGIPEFLSSARGVLRQPPVFLVDGALATLGPLGELLLQTALTFGPAAPGGPEALNQSVAVALQSLAGFGHWLRSETKPAPDVTASVLGTVRFERRLNHRFAVRASAAELARYAARLMTETEAALTAQAAALGSEGGWRGALARVEQGRTDPLPVMREEIARVRGLLTERAVVPVPAAGPDLIALPPPLVPLLPGIVYLPVAGQLAVAPARRSRFAVPALVAAYALPGRHLLEIAAGSTGSLVRRRLRSPVIVDGWSLYAEELAEDLAPSAAKEARLLRLARLLRAAARLAADVGIHTLGMAPVDAITLLSGRAGVDPARAEAEVRRIVARPTDAGAAAIGRREILALRSAAGASPGDTDALARFHDALLAFGALPPGLAAWGLGIDR